MPVVYGPEVVLLKTTSFFGGGAEIVLGSRSRLQISAPAPCLQSRNSDVFFQSSFYRFSNTFIY